MIEDADEALEGHFLFDLVGDAKIVRRPSDAARKVGDLNLGFAVEFALHIPVQHLRLGVWERCVEHIQLVRVGQEFKLDARGIDESVRPGKLQWIHPFLESHRAGFTNERYVLAVVNRELHRAPGRDGGEVNVFGASGSQADASEERDEKGTQDR